MFFEKQNNYLKRKKDKKMKEPRKKKDRLKYLMKKAVQQLSSKERKELKQLQGEMKKHRKHILLGYNILIFNKIIKNKIHTHFKKTIKKAVGPQRCQRGQLGTCTCI